jgi:hypothetical protein
VSDQLILNRYRPIAEAGSGGFATVQLAWDTRIQRRVAIKCIQLNEHDVAHGVLSGLDEARTAALLTGSNIVGVYDFEVQDTLAYLIMEYVDGLTLTQVLEQFGDQLTLNTIAAVFVAVAQALETAHENQVLHLDIKPDNILINRQGQVKVTDFGLATLSDAAGYGSASGGTIGYMPPEQIRQENLDARCDEWALASVTYEMLTGNNPFLAKDLASAEVAIEEAEIVLPSLCREDLEPQADDVLFYALDPDREERYSSIDEFAEEMEVFLGNPAKGKRELAVLVGEAREDFEPEAERTARIPLFDRWTGRTKETVDRVFSFLNAALLSLLALGTIPLLNGFTDPILWALFALISIAAIMKPHLGAILGLLTLCVSLLINGEYLLGILLLIATPCWWFFVARKGANQTNTALSPVLFGCFGLSQLSPILIGFCLTLRETFINVAMALLLACILAGYGSQSLLGWEPLVFVQSASFDVQAGVWQLLQQPSTWCIVIAWFVAAVLMRVFCLRQTRLFAFFGVLLATAILLFAVMLGAWLGSGQQSWIPEWPLIIGSVSAGVIAGILCLFGVPIRPDEEAEE